MFFYDIWRESALLVQVQFIFILIAIIWMYTYLIKSAYIIFKYKLQQAHLIGFKRKVRKCGPLIFPAYKPVVAYKDAQGQVQSVTLKKILNKKCDSIDVFVNNNKVRFISLLNLGFALFFMGILSELYFAFNHNSNDYPFVKFFMASYVLLSYFFLRSHSQYHHYDKLNPFTRILNQKKLNKKLASQPLSDDEYGQLTMPDKILSYEEMKILPKKEMWHVNFIYYLTMGLILAYFLYWEIK